jgi:hypothetical protein
VIRFDDLRSLLANYLDDPMLAIEPGPDDPIIPGRWVKITREAGPGLTTESMFEQILFSVEVAGDQEDYNSAESLAFDVDRFFLRQTRQKVGGVLVLSWTRGGGPQPLSIDNARRWHFACSYTLDVQSALTA